MTRRLLPIALLLAAALAVGALLWSDSEPSDAPETEIALTAPSDQGLEPAPTETEGTRVTERRGLVETTEDSFGGAELLPSFSGRLLDPQGRPLANTTIEAHGKFGWAISIDLSDPRNGPEISWEAETDALGRFRFPEAPRDGLRFLVRARVGGYAPLELVNLPATPGRTRDLGDLTFHKGFALAGRVVDESGAPIKGAEVVPVSEPDQANLSAWVRNRLQPLAGYRAITDDNGDFALDALPPGRVRLIADAPGFAPHRSDGAQGLEGDSINGLELVLRPAVSLAGIVRDTGGFPVANAHVRFEAASGDRQEVNSDATGAFTFEIDSTPERVELACTAEGYRPAKKGIPPRNLSSPIVFELLPMRPLSGAVVDTAGNPVEGATVVLLEARRARSRPENPAAVPPVAETQSLEDGSFELAIDLSETWDRTFMLAAWAPGMSPTVSGGLSLATDIADERNYTLTLEQGRFVEGRVLDPAGMPLAGARAYLRRLQAAGRRPGVHIRVPESRRPGQIVRQVSTAADGTYRFEGLASAEYRIEAHAPGFSPSESEEFHLVDASLTANVQLSYPSRIIGVVTGRLDLFRQLRVTAAAPLQDPVHTAIDSEGKFAFDVLPPDLYQLIVREVDPGVSSSVFHAGAGDGLARADGVELLPGDTTEVVLHIDLSDRSVLSGVVRVNGEPSPDVGLYLVPRDIGAGSDVRLMQRAVLNRLRSTATDFQGIYRFAGVDPGDYWLVADRAGSPPNQVMNFREVEGGPAALSSATVSMPTGGEYAVDVDIAVGSLEGRALRPEDGKLIPVRALSGFLTPADGRTGVADRPLTIRKNGRFQEAWLPEGRWLLTLNGEGHAIRSFPVEITAGATSRVEPELTPAGTAAVKPIQ